MGPRSSLSGPISWAHQDARMPYWEVSVTQHKDGEEDDAGRTVTNPSIGDR